PFKWGDAFTEGNSWHYSWSVFHDVEGLIGLMGGKKMFTAMLDSVFNLPPVYDESYYGGVIHEIREMQIMNMGQYAHGNQPIQHMIYLYNYAGQPWKTQYWVRQALDRLYAPTPDGYCGDEDNGQTSAWYVFSALGFYPVCPGVDQYVLGAPLFKKVTVSLENGKKLVIEAPANSAKNVYVQNLQFNGAVHNKNWIGHSDLMKGGALRFTMGAQPNTTRGISDVAAPYSLSKEQPQYTLLPQTTPDVPTTFEAIDSVTRNGFTLVFINRKKDFDTALKRRLIETHFTVYPEQVKRFNPNATRRVTFFIDPEYTGVAEAARGRVRFNPDWFRRNPNDIDVVTHEDMHIVQSYGRSTGPGWLTEGIADYVRYQMGVNNQGSGWALPAFDPKHSYANSYRITARFLAWMVKNVRPTLVDELDAALRKHTYTAETWKELTGKTLDENWQAYAAAPAL
ncbi:MAG TPA: GH92 family glycosyl hydrolase, partial [Chitinophagaceae bacterium]|nr:GH92 family glycosyl hydrolase [Chitinophagaceae bacterium]